MMLIVAFFIWFRINGRRSRLNQDRYIRSHLDVNLALLGKLVHLDDLLKSCYSFWTTDNTDIFNLFNAAFF